MNMYPIQTDALATHVLKCVCKWGRGGTRQELLPLSRRPLIVGYVGMWRPGQYCGHIITLISHFLSDIKYFICVRQKTTTTSSQLFYVIDTPFAFLEPRVT